MYIIISLQCLLCSLLCWLFGVQALFLEITLMVGMKLNWWKGRIDYEGWSLKEVSCPELWSKGIDSCSDEHKLKKALLGLYPVIRKGSGFPFYVKILHCFAWWIRLPVEKLLLKIKSLLQFTQVSRKAKLVPQVNWWS